MSAAVNPDLPAIHISGKSVRDRVMDWVAIRSQYPTMKNSEIAERLGISTRSLNSYINHATREGWLKFDDPVSRVEHEIIPKALDNVSEFLDKKDRSVTIEVAKGVIFPRFKEATGIQEGNNIFALKIEVAYPDAPPPAQISTGSSVGKPKELSQFIDVEVTNQH